MKNTLGLLLALLGFAGFGATYSDPVMVSINGTLQAPTNFFLANTGAITAALTASGWSPSSGNANTNAANAWAAGFTQTFLGPVAWGTTNAISEVAGKQGLDPDLTALAAISGVSGDIIYHNGTNWVRLPKGTDGQALQLSSGFPSWATLAGSGDVVGPASSTDSVVALYDGTTGKLLKDGTLTEAAINAHLTEAEASALYQRTNAALTALAGNPSLYQSTNSALTALASNPSLYQSTNTHLTDLSDGTLTGSKVGTGITADNITAGTLSSNRLPAAVSFTTIDVGTINATAVVGDASGLTGINATNVTAGELEDALITATIARTNAPTLHSPTLLTPSLGVASATSLTLGATNVVSELALKAPLASPALTGTPTVNSTNLMAEVNAKAPLASPALTGSPTVNGTNLMASVHERVLRAGDTMTGTLTLSGTAAPGTSNSVAASTKYVDDAVAAAPAGSGVDYGEANALELKADFMPYNGPAHGQGDYAGLALNGGGSVGLNGVSNHWGVVAIRSSSSTPTNSGYAFTTELTAFTQLQYVPVATGYAWVKPYLDAGISRFGFMNGSTTNIPTDGIWLQIGETNNYAELRGVVMSNAIPAATLTSTNLVNTAWYLLEHVVSGTSNIVTFNAYDDNRNLIWTDSITNGLPLGARTFGHGIRMQCTNLVQTYILQVDRLRLRIPSIR